MEGPWSSYLVARGPTHTVDVHGRVLRRIYLHVHRDIAYKARGPAQRPARQHRRGNDPKCGTKGKGSQHRKGCWTKQPKQPSGSYLQDPVTGREVQATGSDVGGEEDGGGPPDEVEVDVGAPGVGDRRVELLSYLIAFVDDRLRTDCVVLRHPHLTCLILPWRARRGMPGCMQRKHS